MSSSLSKPITLTCEERLCAMLRNTNAWIAYRRMIIRKKYPEMFS